MNVLLLNDSARVRQLLAESPYRERAKDRPIEGRLKDLAREVRRLLGWDGDDRPFVSTRTAARKTGLSNGTIASLAHGDPPSATSILKFANGMNGSAKLLLELSGLPAVGDQGEDPLSRIGPDADIAGLGQIPLADFPASAGAGSMVPDTEVEQNTLESELPGELRAIRVVGECMEPRYCDGDILLIREQKHAENGQRVIALVDDDTLNCKVYRTNGEAYLEPTNGEGRIPAHRFKIVGVVAAVLRKE
jgi:hypothetical protein